MKLEPAVGQAGHRYQNTRYKANLVPRDPHGFRSNQALCIPRDVSSRRRYTPAFAPGSGMDEDELERYRAGVHRHDFDQTTGPYPLETYHKWRRMSSYITEATLDACGISAGTRIMPGDPDAALDGGGGSY